MVALLTQSDFRRIQKLSFCYLCGKTFVPQDKTNRDHVPPQAIFAVADRLNPLILPTHESCNHGESVEDEKLGQLLAVSHGKYPREERNKLDVKVVVDKDTGEEMLGLAGVRLHKMIGRWLRGFHAALYGEYLPYATKSFQHLPFQAGEIKGGEAVMSENLDQHRMFVRLIKQNRQAGMLDRLVSNNGKCVYECTWSRTDDGQPICFFALNVYDWKRLGDSLIFPQRGCVGMYVPESGLPQNATVATTLEIPITNHDELDPFGG